jgi:hypothetical protein
VLSLKLVQQNAEKIVPDLPLDCGRGCQRAGASCELIEERGGDALEDILAGRCGERIAERLLKCCQGSILGHAGLAACGR